MQTTNEAKTTHETQTTHKSQPNREVQPTHKVKTTNEMQTTHEAQTTSQPNCEAQPTNEVKTTNEMQTTHGAQTTHKSQPRCEAQPTHEVLTTNEVRTTHEAQTAHKSQPSCEAQPTHEVLTTNEVQTTHEAQTAHNSQPNCEAQPTHEVQTTPQARTTQNPLASFAKESNPAQWLEEANRLFNHGEFDEAILAFNNAKDDYMVAVATAYKLREVARDIPVSATRRRREAFLGAARSFESCAKTASSAEEECTHYAAAARCYTEINRHQDVVRALKLANMFTEVASYCFDHNLPDKAASTIKKHGAQVDSNTTECVNEVAHMSYQDSKDIE